MAEGINKVVVKFICGGGGVAVDMVAKFVVDVLEVGILAKEFEDELAEVIWVVKVVVII